MAFNIKTQNLSDQAEAGYEFELIYPSTGEPLGAFIKVKGKESKSVKAFLRRRADENQILIKKGKKKSDDMTYADLIDLQVELAVEQTIGWRGIETEDGVELPFSKENAEKLYREHEWVREAVETEASDIRNFRPV